MSQVLKDLYYGNIGSCEKSFDRNWEYGKKFKTVSETEEKLLTLFEGDEKELFKGFFNVHCIVSRIAVGGGFEDSSFLGIQITVEVITKRI